MAQNRGIPNLSINLINRIANDMDVNLSLDAAIILKDYLRDLISEANKVKMQNEHRVIRANDLTTAMKTLKRKT